MVLKYDSLPSEKMTSSVVDNFRGKIQQCFHIAFISETTINFSNPLPKADNHTLEFGITSDLMLEVEQQTFAIKADIQSVWAADSGGWGHQTATAHGPQSQSKNQTYHKKLSSGEKQAGTGHATERSLTAWMISVISSLSLTASLNSLLTQTFPSRQNYGCKQPMTMKFSRKFEKMLAIFPFPHKAYGVQITSDCSSFQGTDS